MQDKVGVTNGMIQANKIAQWRDGGVSLISRNTYRKAVGKHCSNQNEQSTHARPESAVHVIGPAGGGSTKLNAVAAEFTPSSAHQQTNNSWCAKYIADMTGVNGGHMANQAGKRIGNGHDSGAPVGGGVFNRFKTNYEQATIGGIENINVTQNETNSKRGFPHGTRLMNETADSLVNTHESDYGIYLNNNLQTLVSKRMCLCYDMRLIQKMLL